MMLLGNSAINFVTPSYDVRHVAVLHRPGHPSGQPERLDQDRQLQRHAVGAEGDREGHRWTVDVGQSNRWIGRATADQVLRVMTGTAPVADEKIPVSRLEREQHQPGDGPMPRTATAIPTSPDTSSLWGVSG